MLRSLLFLVGFALLAMTACKSDKKGDDMSQFADDEAFRAAHLSPDSIDFVPRGRMTQFNIPGQENGLAYIISTTQPSNKYLFVFHEWWGLNAYIKREAERFFSELGDVNVVAIDLYEGKEAKNADDASKFMAMVTEKRASAIIQGALNMTQPTDKVATIGWCFGGGWSLKAAIIAGSQGVGSVMYYGVPVQQASEIARLQAPVLGIFAKQDQWITPEVVNKFEDLTKATGKNLEVHSFNANHAFANPSSPDYNSDAAQEANKLALNFLKEKLGSGSN